MFLAYDLYDAHIQDLYVLRLEQLGRSRFFEKNDLPFRARIFGRVVTWRKSLPNYNLSPTGEKCSYWLSALHLCQYEWTHNFSRTTGQCYRFLQEPCRRVYAQHYFDS
jgi:hypothetical protein